MYIWEMNCKKKRINRVTPLLVNILAVLFFHASSYHAYSQISYGGRPLKTGLMGLEKIPVITMPEFDHANYLKATRDETEDSRLKPLVFAKSFAVNIDPKQDGIWEELPGGKHVWRIALESRGAYSLNIIFSKFALNPGSSFFIYNADRSHILGSYDYRNNQPSGSLAVEPVRGDKLIVEMQVTDEAKNFGKLIIGSLNHDFIGITGLKTKQSGPSGKCNIDISCPPGNQWQTEKYSVARIVINGFTLCTGVLVNNTANNGKPYIITANHCINDSSKAANSVFLFGYESPFCNGGPGPTNNTRSGSDLLATQANLDFSLVELREMPPQSWYIYYAGWNRSGEIPENTFSIHHPSGDVKKIAVDHDPPSTATFGPGYTLNGHWQINRWDLGTTEPGSSGSPLFDHDGYLTGFLTGGDARCGNAVNDFFCKFSLAWDRYAGSNRQLEPWLDPLGSGAVSLQGINPFAGNELSAGFQVSSIEICEGDQLVFTDFSTGNIDSWLWDFGSGANPPNASTRGPHIVTYSESGTRSVSLTVTGEDSSDTKNMEYTLTVKTSELPVSGFSYSHDDLSVQFNDMSENAASYYWEFGDRNTSTLSNPVRNYSTEGTYTVKQLVRNRACSDTSAQIIILSPNLALPNQPDGKLRIYPVPANSYLIVESGMPFSEDIRFELLSISGRSLLMKRPSPGESRLLIDLGRIPSGTYLLKILSGQEHFTTKITIIR